MKDTRAIMGMPVTVEVVDESATAETLEKVFDYFHHVDEKFSTYKDSSEISAINRGELKIENSSDEMRQIFRLAQETKQQTNGYFDISHGGKYDPSGIVKGWAIWKAAQLLEGLGMKNFYLDVGGDIQVSGTNQDGKLWSVGIKNPLKQDEIVKILYVDEEGVATSGTYIRGQHIYNPFQKGPIEDIVSLTVIGPNIYEADRFATAAFAMGAKGIEFIEKLEGFEAYQIDRKGQATFTSNFLKYTNPI